LFVRAKKIANSILLPSPSQSRQLTQRAMFFFSGKSTSNKFRADRWISADLFVGLKKYLNTWRYNMLIKIPSYNAP
jgi:hypothetical protein